MASKILEKPRSRVVHSRSVTPAGDKAESSSENRRKARRRRAKEEKEEKIVSSHTDDNDNPEAGPSKLTNAATAGFGDEDYIAFDLSEEDEGPVRELEPEDKHMDSREAAAGKGKVREYESIDAGRKRKSDEMESNHDSYATRKERMDATTRQAPWAVNVEWDACRNVAEMLHREVDAFVKYMSPSPAEDEVRSLIVQSISNAVTKAYPDAKVLPFGSYQTKLYLPSGDIDLVIESRSMAASRTPAVLQSLANTMRKAGITEKVTIIAKAKVPIIKFITRHGRFSVDISINQTNGVKAGNMINRFLQELPALRALVLITKAFLSDRKMNEVYTGGLGSYSIVCLAISFLQQHPKIRRGEIDPSQNLGVLMMDFFDLYGHYFRYDEVGISVRDGGSYYKKQQRGWFDYKAPGLLSIEDPGDPSNDISRGSFAIARVRTSLSGAFKMLSSSASIRNDYISSLRNRRHHPLQTRHDPEFLSILSSVMGIRPEIINHRRLVQEVYDSRVLHQMVGADPIISLLSTKPSSSRAQPKMSQRSREADASVRAAWEEVDSDPESGEERAHRSPHNNEEEESRYDISDKKQPPRKRRRVGTEKDIHTVYTSDEDEDDGLSVGGRSERLILHADIGHGNARSVQDDSELDSVAAEEAEYALNDEDDKQTRAQNRRSYWLSKGVATL